MTEGYLSSCSTNGLGGGIREALLDDGYAVVRGVLSRAECAAQLDLMWDFVERSSGGRVSRFDAQSWYPSAAGASGVPEDPWPHSGWKSFCDMFQTRGAGWVFCGLREVLADRVFAPLWGTRALHCSKEGFTFHRPTEGGRHPSAGRTIHVCGKPQLDSCGEHFDQGAGELGLHYVQSSTCIVDQGQADACFMCWPGSHRMHASTVGPTYRGRSNWVPLTGQELQALSAAGLRRVRVPVAAGDVILWRSDLAHAAAPPLGESPNFRAVVFAAMLPATLTPGSVLPLKYQAYVEARTGDHGASRESWHAEKGGVGRELYSSGSSSSSSSNGDSVGAGKEGAVSLPVLVPPPKLTHRQAQLHGVIPY